MRSTYELDFPDGMFDAVVILNSLHGMKTPDTALREALRVLGPSGVLLAPAYCHAETEDNLARYLHWASKSGHKPYHLFTCDTLCALVPNCGFAVEEPDVLHAMIRPIPSPRRAMASLMPKSVVKPSILIFISMVKTCLTRSMPPAPLRSTGPGTAEQVHHRRPLAW